MSDEVLIPGNVDGIIRLVANGVRVEHTVSTSPDFTTTSWTFTAADDDDGDEPSTPVEDDLAYLQRRKGIQDT